MKEEEDGKWGVKGGKRKREEHTIVIRCFHSLILEAAVMYAEYRHQGLKRERVEGSLSIIFRDFWARGRRRAVNHRRKS